MQTGPECGSRKPKELVEGPEEFDWVPWLIVSLATCGFGLVFFYKFQKRQVYAYCDRCGLEFAPR